MAATVTVEEARDMALQKAQAVIDAWAACIAAGRTISTKAIADLKMEELIEVLMERFPDEVDPQLVPQIFSSGFNALNHADLARLPEELVSVALMREVLHKKKVMFDPKNVRNWDAFVDRFGSVIIAACR